MDYNKETLVIRIREVELATGLITKYRVLRRLDSATADRYSTSHMTADEKASTKLIRKPADWYEW